MWAGVCVDRRDKTACKYDTVEMKGESYKNFFFFYKPFERENDEIDQPTGFPCLESDSFRVGLYDTKIGLSLGTVYRPVQ